MQTPLPLVGLAQVAPQALQLFGSIIVLVHMPEQFVRPDPQVVPHVPLLQAVPAGHTWPQEPQFWSSLLGLVQIAAGPVPHLVSLTRQVVPHVPLLQDVPDAHAVPQAPQLLLSDWRLTHALPQRVAPNPHTVAQVPAVQVWPVKQALPQLPQFFPSVVVSTQALLQTLSLLLGHTAHLPSEQSSPAGQAVPQTPQLAGSVRRFVQKPPAEQRVSGDGHGGNVHTWRVGLQ